MRGMLFDIWRYRFFIFSSIKTEFRTQFIRSRLGGLWMVLQPLAQVLIFAFILSAIMSAKLPGITNKYGYSIYLMAGIAAWSLFVEILSRCVSLFIDNGNLMKKLVFPKITLPLIVVGRALVNNVLLLLAILIIFGFLGHWPNSSLVCLPIVMLITITLALGLGLVLGILNVFMRDIGQIIPILLQIWFWFTPIVYMVNIIPEKYHLLLALNPLYSLIDAYHTILLYRQVPHWTHLIELEFIALIILSISLTLFRRASPEMVDLL